MKQSDLKENIKYWLDSGKKDLDVALSLFKSKHYPQCLFFCHLALEKSLKAIVIKTTKDHPPYIHDLRKLAETAKLKLNPEQEAELDDIFTFNIAGRYAGEKSEFYKKYNKKDYANKYLKIAKKLYLWLKKESQQK